MANWSELESNMLVHVAKQLNLIEDYLNFASVCKTWRRVATKDNFNSDLPRAPWLMLAEEGDDRELFSLYNGMILKKRIPKARGKRCMESKGWLITIGKDEGEISLLHPFSGVEIKLPHQNQDSNPLNKTRYLWNSIHKAVLSASPSQTSDYIVMVIQGANLILSFWRPGDLRWSSIEIKNCFNRCLHDVVYFNGKFYAINWHGRVLVCDVTAAKAQKVARSPLDIPPFFAKCYILESLGSLLVLVRRGDMCRSKIPFTRLPRKIGVHNEVEVPGSVVHKFYRTKHFQVYKVDLAAGKFTEIKQLGDIALFLGANASLSVQASLSGVKPNRIYFTDDCYEVYSNYEEGGGLDMGVFNITNGTFEPHYKGLSLNRFTPPIWVTPTLY